MKRIFFKAAVAVAGRTLLVCTAFALGSGQPHAVATTRISQQQETARASTPLRIHLTHGGSFDARSVSIADGVVTVLLAQPAGGEVTLTPERIVYTEFAVDALWPQFFQLQASGDSKGAHRLFATMYNSYLPAMPLVSAATLERLCLVAENALEAGEYFFAIALARQTAQQATARQIPELATRLADTEMIALWQLELFAEAEALATQAIANSSAHANALAAPSSALPYALKAASELTNGNAQAALTTALHPIVLANALHSPRHLDAAYAVALLACDALEQPQTAAHLRKQAARRNALPASLHARVLAPALFEAAPTAISPQ